MNSSRPNHETTPVNVHNSTESSWLLPETEKYVRDLAKKPGNQGGLVAQIARSNRDAAERGPRMVAEKQLEAALRQQVESEAHLHEAKSRERYAEPEIILKGGRAKMGFVGGLFLMVLLLGLVFVLWNENGAAAQALLSTGAFDVDNLVKARIVMLTPMAVGIAFILGFRALPWLVRRRTLQVACAVLLIMFLTWAVSFSLQAQRYREDASHTISLSDEAWADSSSDSGRAIQPGGGLSAWLMFGSLTVIMSLTTFIGHCGVEHYLNRYETWVPNPEHTRAFEDRQVYESELRRIEQEIAEAAGRLSALEASIDKEVTLARALYTSLHNSLSSIAMIVVAGIMLTGCGSSLIDGELALTTSQSDRSDGHKTAVTRVLAISPLLPRAEKEIVRQQLESEITWISGYAPVGSATVVVDGLACVPIARLEAVPGVSRIRKKALANPVRAIRHFLDEPHEHVKDDGRVHFARLAQTAKQWSLPPGSHVVVLGNPLFLNDSADKFFSMADGHVPSDGCLFEAPQLNLYSTLGREKALTGQYWHLGWSHDSVFEDDSHRQAVLRFWFLYFQSQSAVLVTAQPSFAAATAAAKDGATDPLMHADVDSNTRAAMVKIIKVQHEEVVEVVAKTTDDIHAQADALHTSQHVASELAVIQPVVESENAQDEQQAQNELATTDANVREVIRDEHDNVKGSQNDLIADGQMVGNKIVLATFYSDDEVERSPLTKALAAKGFVVERVTYPLPELRAFDSMLDESDQLWIWSSAEPDQLPAGHIQAIVERWKAGKLALCLLADNTPFTSEASSVLSVVSPGCTISGDYKGNRTLRAGVGARDGFDPAFPLFHNVTTLYEGSTVSTMSGPGLRAVCFASDGSPLIATLQQEGSSRLVVHGGFTSFYQRFWDDAGVSRFAVNCAGWLNGTDVKLDRASE